MKTIIKIWDEWCKLQWPERYAAYIVIAIFLVFALTGCATSVATKHVTTNGECSSKVTGLFVAHGFSIPDACKLD